MGISTFFTLAIVSLALPSLGQQLNHSIQGSVTFDGGFTFQSIAVYLESLSTRPIEEVYVDVSGNFVFRNVPVGTYYIRVKHEGFQEFAQRIEVPAYNRDVTIFLQRKPNAPASQAEVLLGDRFKVDIRQLSVPEKAVREYKQALEDDKRGKTSRAIERLRRALNIAPDFLEAAAHLGSTLYKAGHFEDAEKALGRALTMAPKDPHLRLMLANVFAKEGKYQQALTEIDTYLKENPKGPERKSAETTRSQLIQASKR